MIDVIWAKWLVSVIIGAIVAGYLFWKLESPGLKPGKGERTLSWHIRRWLGIRPYNPRKHWMVPLFMILCMLWIGGGVWFLIHIVWQ